jgi:hypothetical protein
MVVGAELYEGPAGCCRNTERSDRRAVAELVDGPIAVRKMILEGARRWRTGMTVCLWQGSETEVVDRTSVAMVAAGFEGGDRWRILERGCLSGRVACRSVGLLRQSAPVRTEGGPP